MYVTANAHCYYRLLEACTCGMKRESLYRKDYRSGWSICTILIKKKPSKEEALLRLYESYLTVCSRTFVVKLLHNQRDFYSKTVALCNNEKHVIGARENCVPGLVP